MGDGFGEGSPNSDTHHVRFVEMQWCARRNPTLTLGIDENVGQGLPVYVSNSATAGHVRLPDQQEQVEMFLGWEFDLRILVRCRYGRGAHQEDAAAIPEGACSQVWANETREGRQRGVPF